MTDILLSLSSIRFLDDLSRGKSPVHALHPLAKFLVTVFFLVAVAATSKREVVGLLPFTLYPVLVIAMADLPVAPIVHRLVLASPLFIGIGALNPFFDREAVAFGTFAVGGGWLVFASILIKGILTVSAAIVLVTTTGMDGIGRSMRSLALPRIIVLQVRFTYRYLSLLLEELARTVRAHELRSPLRRGVGKAARGSLPGRLLVRTWERGNRIHDAMLLRGFTGEYRIGDSRPFRLRDGAYTACWAGYFAIALAVDLSGLLGKAIFGVFA